MFPKDWDAERIQAEVDAAWNSPGKTVDQDGKWHAETPSGVPVEGWIEPKTTAYPVYNPTK